MSEEDRTLLRALLEVLDLLAQHGGTLEDLRRVIVRLIEGRTRG